MSRFNSGFEIGRSTGVCAATGAPIEEGQRYVVALCERENEEGLDRLDFSQDAWESGARPERLYSWWRCEMSPTKNRNPLVDDEVLMNLFQRLEGDEQPLRIAYRFVLCLILIRKKHLKVVRTRPGCWEVRAKGDPPETPPMEVVDPHLSEEQVREVSDQLGEILRGDL